MTTYERESRHFVSRVELRAADENQPPKLAGEGAVINKWSQDLGGFRERIAPGAFTAALEVSDPRALFNHNPDHLLGRQSAGTLRLTETREALEYEVDPADTQLWRDLREHVRLKNITGNSFSFIVEEDQWKEPAKPGDLAERTILKFREIVDVGPVTFPAYEQTTVSARSIEQARKCLEEAQRARSARWQDEAEIARHQLLGLDVLQGF